MRIRRILIALTVVVAVACGGKPSSTATTDPGSTGGPKSLYDRLGGKDAIVGVVDQFVANILADTRVNVMFANADLTNLKTKLADQICQETGGPCKYTGKNMKDAHVGMNIKDADFDALADDLAKALDTFRVPAKEKAELLAAIGKMRADIVTAK
jgi:hemoglobin